MILCFIAQRPRDAAVFVRAIAALAALLACDPVFGAELSDGILTIRSADYAAFTGIVAGVARDAGVSLYELRPTDESLESVFQYLVAR